MPILNYGADQGCIKLLITCTVGELYPGDCPQSSGVSKAPTTAQMGASALNISVIRLTTADLLPVLGCVRSEGLSVADAASRQVEAKSPVSDEELYMASHFCNYAFAAYGYMLFIWSKPRQ